MAGVRRKKAKRRLADSASAKEMYRQARIAVQSLSTEKRTELANMLMSAYDWRKQVKEWEK